MANGTRYSADPQDQPQDVVPQDLVVGLGIRYKG